MRNLYPQADFGHLSEPVRGLRQRLAGVDLLCLPLVIGRYSVYQRDIEPKGFRLPAMDERHRSPRGQRDRRHHRNPDYREALVEHNYRVASRFFSYRVLRDSLRGMINNVRNVEVRL